MSDLLVSIDLYEVRSRKDHRAGEPYAISNAISYAKFRNRSHDAPVSSSYQTESNEYTAAIDETLVSLTGFC